MDGSNSNLNLMEHVKYYNDIRLPYDRLVKKAIAYANTTEETKVINVSTSSLFIRIKNTSLSIKPNSSGYIQIRMFFDKTMSPNQRGDLYIVDGAEV